MFWREVVKSTVSLLKIYGALAVVVVAVVGVASIVWLLIGRITKFLEWSGVSALLTKLHATIGERIRKVGQVGRGVVSLFLLALWVMVRIVILPLLGYLTLALWLWFLVYFLVLGGLGNQHALPWAIGSVGVSLLLCLLGWPLLLRLDKEKPRLSHLSRVIAVAVLWVAPIVAAFPIVMTSD